MQIKAIPNVRAAGNAKFQNTFGIAVSAEEETNSLAFINYPIVKVTTKQTIK